MENDSDRILRFMFPIIVAIVVIRVIYVLYWTGKPVRSSTSHSPRTFIVLGSGCEIVRIHYDDVVPNHYKCSDAHNKRKVETPADSFGVMDSTRKIAPCIVGSNQDERGLPEAAERVVAVVLPVMSDSRRHCDDAVTFRSTSPSPLSSWNLPKEENNSRPIHCTMWANCPLLHFPSWGAHRCLRRPKLPFPKMPSLHARGQS
ncbi:UDP-N-acetylglucosamine transferase subunit ALG14 [Musa troglodytarum]|uniref:UDP-N-acetylglucosamine transferase subunit ALG14 n=1 Tax=Musa troglodytarum TaxID=320322 RepID=A0A9E7EEX0_9LILI|nr:UDP-N-acetylglucosamine transferase subunit ALG14 [Musa troglodytarum]